MLNAIGVSVAPLFLGLLSDGFTSWAGAQALRYAMMVMSLSTIPAAVAFALGAPKVASCRED
ncbi:exported hypothetical protein [Novosphingobium sp. KN65.2]|nr:exported hypothetical protein [Novosphingobium sp. KN65.2]